MERVGKGEKYWYLDLVYLDVIETQEMNNRLDNFHYRKNNYFATKEEAEAMARKLRAVLKGADVIEMPSEEEICGQCQKEWIANGGSIGDKRMFNDILLTAYSVIKDKIK